MVTKIAKIMIVVLLVVPLMAQTITSPIITEKEVVTEVKISMLDKDEIQRAFDNLIEIVNKQSERINSLEGRILTLENQ